MAVESWRWTTVACVSLRWLGPSTVLVLMLYVLFSSMALVSVPKATTSTHLQDTAGALPRLVIYRRSPKTASTSMAAALVEVMGPLGYELVKSVGTEVGNTQVFTNLHNPQGKPVFVFNHNSYTRNVTTRADVIIMDTFRDGYQHMTSFCRTKRSYESCDDHVADCLENNPGTLKQRYFRWAGRPEEDADTFIDIPLSSEHPALSTSALRTVFPNVLLRINHFRERHSTCPEIKKLRDIYNRLYTELDDQVDKMRLRLLILTGYPHMVANGERIQLSLSQMVDLAEQMEQHKYDFRPPRKAGVRSFEIEKVEAGTGAWSFSNGKWVVLPSANMKSYELRKTISERNDHSSFDDGKDQFF